MSDIPKPSAKKEYIIANIVLTLILICAYAVGFAGIFLFVLLPSCLSYIFVRFRTVYSLFPVALVVFVPSIIMMSIDIYTLMLVLPTSMLTAYSIRYKRGLLHAVALGSAGWIISLTAMFVLGDFALQLEQTKAVFEASVSMVMEAYNMTSEQGALIYEVFMSLLPSMFVCGTALVTYGAVYICVSVIKRRDTSYFGVYRPFCCIRADKMCILAGVFILVFSFMSEGLILKTLINMLVVLTGFLFVCGISTISFFARKIKNKAVRIIVYILMIFGFIAVSSLYLFVGVIDAFINIRGLKEPGKQE